jgi:HAD superfamily hydrolase (TIGR01509 family)
MNSKVGEMPAVSLLEKLQSSCEVWIISNTTESHIRSLQSKFTFLGLVSGIITSERAGAHKPNQKIFQFALSEANTSAVSSMFIDDSHANVNSVEELGIVSHHYVGFDGLMDFLHPICNFN